MIQISISGYFLENNDFRIKEIYVSDENQSYILKRDESFVPYVYEGSVSEMFDAIKNGYYPSFSMSTPRYYEDNDAKSMATFFSQKIQSIGMNKRESDQVLFDIISGFGDKRAEIT
jgi:hypothetical protein